MRFEGFALDPARCMLLRGDTPIALRPKSFDVLRFLLECAGRTVSKEAIFEAVWPDVSVTDDSLVQCIKEIRQALGDDGKRLVRTIPKRGYLIDATVVVDEAREPEPATSDAIDVPIATPPAPSPVASVPETASLAGSASRSSAPTSRSVVGAAAALLLVVAVAVSVARSRVPVPSANAAHFAIIGTAQLDRERSQQSNLKALALFDKALALEPDQALALVGYARVIVTDITEGWAPAQDRTLRFNQAEIMLKRALAIDPEDGRAHHIYGLLSRARGDVDRAIAELEKALKQRPTKGWVVADLGRAKLEAGRPMEALADLETAIRLDPNEPFIGIWYFQAGMAAVHAEHGVDALAWFAKSEAASTIYHRQIKLWRAVALADAGREMEGRDLIKTYRAESPHITVASWLSHFPIQNPMATSQRMRIGRVLSALGLPQGDLQFAVAP